MSQTKNCFEFWISKNLPAQRFDVFLHYTNDTQHVVAAPVLMTTLTPEQEGSYQPPLLSLHKEEAQQLMDELWHAGIRPTNEVGSVGELKATQAHLQDMRVLVQGFMELKK